MKKTMKKLVALIMSITLMTMALIGCGSKDAGSSDSGNKKVFKIGVLQLMEHDALDAAYKGFVDGLADAGYVDGENIKLDFNNAQNDQSNCSTIASKLINNKSDLILAIATPAAQAVANATKDIPILVTAVTDPTESGLVAANDAPGGNVTGTSDLNPVKEQIALLKQLIPDVKKVAMLYCSAESNSKIQVDLAIAECQALGIETVEATVSNSNEIQQVVQSLVGKVDAIYSPTDNMIAQGMATVSTVTQPNKIPVIVGEENMVKNGGLATYGLDYYNLGRQTAAQAVKILTAESKPADMPIEYLTDCELFINQEVAEEMGITIPDELLKQLEQ